MSGVAYVNGAFVPLSEAQISIFDRGFLFADAVYEVWAVIEGRMIDRAAHIERLERSLRELDLLAPVPLADIAGLQRTLLDKNALEEGLLYLQISRGPADRDFAFPGTPRPSLVMFVQERSVIDTPSAKKGISVITVPDIRWRRRDIKTVGLLAASMAKEAAIAAGADDAWLIEDGFVTEGTSANAFILTFEGVLVTRALGNEILHGITRRAVMRLIEEEGIRIEERAFSVDEAINAREAFSTSASSLVQPVVRIDGRVLGNGAPGAVTMRLRALYIEAARAGC